MSISLLIKDPKQKNDRIVPIAAEDTFLSSWLPVAKQLRLQWIPIFQTGLPISNADIPFVLQDLRLLKKVTSEPASGEVGGVAKLMTERIERLIAELEALKDEPNVDAYIG